ncbi:MAG: hypothetical protein HXY34_01105 [Candidatus Thorarchaeota archaeon]|nr:hypothetical protein [Candidatus Thorarchaeota archaeon]
MTRTEDIHVALRDAATAPRQVLREPVMKILLRNSNLTEAQLETLLLDLVIEDALKSHVPYEQKASLRTRKSRSKRGVSRGSYNRTLRQARRNVIQSIYTMLLLAYLGLFDQPVFRPFEEIAARIGNYRRIRDALAGRSTLTSEDLEVYRVAEETIVSALEGLGLPLVLKSRASQMREM